MHHGAVFGAVDWLAGKHRIAVSLEPALARQIEQQRFGRGVDQVFRQVGEYVRRLLAEVLETHRIGRESLTHIKCFAARIEAASE